MTKHEFIRKLREGLKKLPSSLVDDIVSDYEEHFEMGLSQGKDEGSIASGLGDPGEIAKEYLSQYEDKLKKSLAKESKRTHDEDDKGMSININLPKTVKYLLIAACILIAVVLLPVFLKAAVNIVIGLLSFILVMILVSLILTAGALFYVYKVLPKKFSSWKKKTFKSGSGAVTGNSKEKFDISEIRGIDVEMQLGSLRVMEDSVDQIEVEFINTSSYDVENVEYIEDGILHIQNGFKEKKLNLKNRESINIEVIIKLPAKAALSLEAELSLGDIRVEASFEDLTLKAALGSIKLVGDQGHVEIESEMGSIKCKDFSGYGDIRNSMGSIKVDFNEFQEGRVKTKVSMGSIKFDKEKYPNYHDNVIDFTDSDKLLNLSTSMGSIKIN